LQAQYQELQLLEVVVVAVGQTMVLVAQVVLVAVELLL
jgi:hypothetical protein